MGQSPLPAPGTREHFLDHLARDWPELLRRYQRLYTGGAYLGRSLAEPVRRRVRDLVCEHGVSDRRTLRLQPPPPDEQLSFPLMPGA